MKKKQKNYNLILGIFIALFMLLFLLAGLFYTPYDPDAMNGAAKFAAPGAEHLFGCDHFGRDILSRVMKGTGTTFLWQCPQSCWAAESEFWWELLPGISAAG